MSKYLAVAVAFVLFLSFTVVSVNVKAQSTGNIVINPDGSVTGTTSIEQVGSDYALTANISGNIQVQKSYITIDGSGHSLNGEVDLTNGIGPNSPSPTRPVITNVTIKNLHVNGGIDTNGGGNNTFYNDCIASIQFLGDCYNNNISFCQIGSIDMDYGGNASLTENNITGGILVWLSLGGTADRNYWSDYLTKYPNATEVDDSGVCNQPYIYATVQNGTKAIYCQDNHPLMKPVTIPLMDSSPSAQTNVPEFPSVLFMIPLIVFMFSVAVIVRHKKQVKKV